VKDISSLSNEWTLTKDERIDLYVKSAQALEAEGDASGAFKVYYEAFRIIEVQKKSASEFKTEAEHLLISAIKSP